MGVLIHIKIIKEIATSRGRGILLAKMNPFCKGVPPSQTHDAPMRGVEEGR